MASVLAANGPDSIIWWDWVRRHTDDIASAFTEHIQLTVVAVVLGLLVSIPFALLARRYRRTRTLIFTTFGVLYTIPSIALFFLLGPISGYTTVLTAELGLVTYTLLILTRNIVIGLDSVSEDLREAARGMGYRSWQLLTRVELPLALPSLMAGLRVATVSTIGLVTIATLIGHGGLGELIIDDGLDRRFSTPLVVGSILVIALALLADLLLLIVQRLLTPWVRR